MYMDEKRLHSALGKFALSTQFVISMVYLQAVIGAMCYVHGITAGTEAEVPSENFTYGGTIASTGLTNVIQVVECMAALVWW